MSETLFSHLKKSLPQEIDYPEADAAVLLLISRENNPSILYTRRALHLRSHPGEICFPGGRRETHDPHLWATALRETHEEIGLPATEIDYLGALRPAVTRAGTQVISFVASFNPDYPLVAELNELDTIFHVPLIDFSRGIKIRDDIFSRAGREYRLPVYQYQEHEIWGFTAGVTEQLLKIMIR
jgi:8-oxo-dGTP pyrophosphatase MutT (NUDIX family)